MYKISNIVVLLIMVMLSSCVFFGCSQEPNENVTVNSKTNENAEKESAQQVAGTYSESIQDISSDDVVDNAINEEELKRLEEEEALFDAEDAETQEEIVLPPEQDDTTDAYVDFTVETEPVPVEIASESIGVFLNSFMSGDLATAQTRIDKNNIVIHDRNLVLLAEKNTPIVNQSGTSLTDFQDVQLVGLNAEKGTSTYFVTAVFTLPDGTVAYTRNYYCTFTANGLVDCYTE